jgi:hypothetical protein
MNMKKNIIFPFLLAATFLFVGCEKNDGFVDKSVEIAVVPQPAVVINGGSASIDLTNLAGFQGKFDVKLLYPNDVQPLKLDVVIRKNSNNANIKLVQAGVTTYPTTLTITAAQIVTLFGGAAIVLGDNYDIGVDIYTQDGKKYEAFPITGAAYGSTGVANQPGFSATIRYSAICAYNPSIYQGNFSAVDAFGDANGATILLTQIDATRFSFIYPSVLNPQPIIVTVNPLNNIATVAAQPIGTQWDPAYGYPGGATYANPSTGASTGVVAPCARTVTLNMVWLTAGGTLTFGGPFPLVLTKI